MTLDSTYASVAADQWVVTRPNAQLSVDARDSRWRDEGGHAERRVSFLHELQRRAHVVVKDVAQDFVGR